MKVKKIIDTLMSYIAEYGDNEIMIMTDGSEYATQITNILSVVSDDESQLCIIQTEINPYTIDNIS